MTRAQVPTAVRSELQDVLATPVDHHADGVLVEEGGIAPSGPVD